MIELNLSTIAPCVAGPKRPHDRVEIAHMKEDFGKCMNAPIGFKGYGISEEKRNDKAKFVF